MNDNQLRRFFEESGAHIVLNPDLTIYQVGPEYARETMIESMPPEQVVGRNFFDVFPTRPEKGSELGAKQQHASLSKVMRTKETDKIGPVRYDVQRPDGSWERRWWRVANIPILHDDGEIVYIVRRIENVTDLVNLHHRVDQQETKNRVLYFMAVALTGVCFWLATEAAGQNRTNLHTTCQQVQALNGQIHATINDQVTQIQQDKGPLAHFYDQHPDLRTAALNQGEQELAKFAPKRCR